MFYTGRQAQWFARGPWLVAGAGALVLLTGFVTVHRHGGHWRDRTALSAAMDVPASAGKSASSGPMVKSHAAVTPTTPQASAAAKPARAALAVAANRSAPAAAPPRTDPPTAASAGGTTPRPSFDVVRVDVGGEAVFAGRGSPGAEITIRDDGKQLGRIKADGTGQWVFLPTAPLDPGSRELTLSEHTPDGADLKSDSSVLLVVPDRAQRQAAADPQPALAVLEPDASAGQGSLRLLQPPPPAGLGPGAHLGLDLVQYDDHGTISFAGSAPPGAPVRLYVDNRPVGDAVADRTGRWVLTPAAATIITTGHHQVRVDELNAQGRVSARVELPFARDIEPSKLPSGGRVVVQPGQNLWVLARQLYGAGHLYTVIYQANRSEIRDPRLIYPGQTFAVPEAAPAPTPGAQTPPAPAAAAPPNAG